MGDTRKQFFIGELKRHYQELIEGAHKLESEAEATSDHIRAEARSKEDGKSAAELTRVAAAQRERRLRAKRELETLIVFAGSGLPTLRADAAVAQGALVDVSIDSAEGTEERTVFVLPVGAGTELSGPGGDGFISVITPSSPVGRGMQGLRAGDGFEVVIDGRDREWTVVDVC